MFFRKFLSLTAVGGSRSVPRRHMRLPRMLSMERLAERLNPAVTAVFNPSAGVLMVSGDDLDNTILVSRDALGQIQVNGGAVTITGGVPTVANTALIQALGHAGHDRLEIVETNGAMPSSQMQGGTGDDILIGGSSADTLFGNFGWDVLVGRAGVDALFGGEDDDLLSGGDGEDQVHGQGENDRFVWNSGDDTDVVEGGIGVDTIEASGGSEDEVFSVTANGTRVRFDRLSPAPFALDLNETEHLIARMFDGDDRFSAVGNLVPLIELMVDGGSGNDTILGGNGPDMLFGGEGNDVLDGNQVTDTLELGSGDDIASWDPGDGSDTIRGGAGADTLSFSGSAANELIELTNNAGRMRLMRNIGNILMDVDDVESTIVRALGGADTITVRDLSATDVGTVTVDLAGSINGTSGDAQADTVIMEGTEGSDSLEIVGSTAGVSMIGGATVVKVANTDGATDAVRMLGLGGNDMLSATTLPAGFVALVMDGGSGNDRLHGSRGADLMLGGDGMDFLDGNQGDDAIHMGAGTDVFQWDPGDGSDLVEGQGGRDRMVFRGSNSSEAIDMSSSGTRLRLLRDLENVLIDANELEMVEVHMFGGTDRMTVNDLATTAVADVKLFLAESDGTEVGDGQTDEVIVNGSSTADRMNVRGGTRVRPIRIPVAGSVDVAPFSVGERNVLVSNGWGQLTIRGSDGESDKLTINGLSGPDHIEARNLPEGHIGLTLRGGADVDTMIGSAGSDLIDGESGNDLIWMGAGDDMLMWEPGDGSDTVEGQDGTDRLQFNGSNAAELFELSASGSRLRLSRNVANIVLSLQDVEIINLGVSGGADAVVVKDLSATDVREINLNLAPAVIGAGDGLVDTITIEGTAGDDALLIADSTDGTTVLGTWGALNISGAEPAHDQLIVNGMSGGDVLDASALSRGRIGLRMSGDQGDDVLIGSENDDILLGGEGDDVLIGGPGDDMLDGGSGSNVLIQ